MKDYKTVSSVAKELGEKYHTIYYLCLRYRIGTEIGGKVFLTPEDVEEIKGRVKK